MAFGIGSALKDLFGKLESEHRKARERVQGEFFREGSDVISGATFGLIDPNRLKQSGKQQRAAKRKAEELQIKQKRKSLLTQSKLESEIAERGATASRGGRGSLLRSGEAGSLLT